jgi:membrane associated rhomboid family serine protease
MLLPIYDRNPLRIIPFQFMTFALIVATVLAFFWQLQLAPPMVERAVLVYGLIHRYCSARTISPRTSRPSRRR